MARGASAAGGAAGVDDPVARAGEAAAELRERYDELRRIEARITELGEERVEAAADAYRQAHRILDGYEDDATGTGDFGAYVQFEGAFAEAVDVPDDALGAAAFTAADDAVDKRRLDSSDFDRAREALEPVEEYIELLEGRDDAVDEYRAARRGASAALDDLRDRVAALERVADMADADLDADVDRLREPVDAYNEAVEAAFESYKRNASARELFDLLELTERYPLVDFERPPRELREYVVDRPAGEEPVPTLLEYADYSPSKLDHYVDDPGALRTTVAVHRTALERIDADPLTLDWPPAEAAELRYRIKELIPIVSRLGDDEAPVIRLRELRKLTNADDYERLRRATEVRTALDDEEFALLKTGRIDSELSRARDVATLARGVLDETDR